MSEINVETRINENTQAQFKAQRFALINKIKELRAERNKLKGVKNTGPQWETLTNQIDEVQNQIDFIGKSLGIKPKANMHFTPAGAPQGMPYSEVKKEQVREGRNQGKPNRRSHRSNRQAHAGRRAPGEHRFTFEPVANK
ncbi:DNA repair protein [Kosakonia phage Kc263]|uniref:DNA repair protein n=1 Tax=Kosakonia phage Kc263 TaxID=2863194 RepID=A0AAE8BEF5_9CAUD|nr:DNA repair protein [Kosakonia phage Kc263]QYN79925.1 DNA repair protein [Kosakonia phage Kc263]